MTDFITKSNSGLPQNEGSIAVNTSKLISIYNGTENDSYANSNTSWGDRFDFVSDYDIREFSVALTSPNEAIEPDASYGDFLIPDFLDGYELFKADISVVASPTEDMSVMLVNKTTGSGIAVMSVPMLIPSEENSSFNSTQSVIIPEKSIFEANDVYGVYTDENGQWASALGLTIYLSCRKMK